MLKIDAHRGNGQVISQVIQSDHDDYIIYEASLTDIRTIRLEFIEMRGQGVPATLSRLMLGPGMLFGSDMISTVSINESATLTMTELAVRTLSASLLDVNGRFDPADETSAMKVLRKGQVVTAMFGQQINAEGVVEWIPSKQWIMNEWRKDGVLVSLTCNDRLGVLASEAYDGAWFGSPQLARR